MRTRFSLGFLLGVVTVCCFLSWLIATRSGPATLGYLAACSTLGALWGHSRRSFAIAYGMAGGVAALVVPLLVDIVLLLIASLGGEALAGEELEELFVALPAIVALIVSVGVMAGAFCGGIVWFFTDQPKKGQANCRTARRDC